MGDDKLPSPATTQDMYAYATVVELRRLNALLARMFDAAQVAATDGDIIELREPVTEKKASTRDAKKAAARGD